MRIITAITLVIITSPTWRSNRAVVNHMPLAMAIKHSIAGRGLGELLEGNGRLIDGEQVGDSGRADRNLSAYSALGAWTHKYSKPA
jgi:hypothetical protein